MKRSNTLEPWKDKQLSLFDGLKCRGTNFTVLHACACPQFADDKNMTVTSIYQTVDILLILLYASLHLTYGFISLKRPVDIKMGLDFCPCHCFLGHCLEHENINNNARNIERCVRCYDGSFTQLTLKPQKKNIFHPPFLNILFMLITVLACIIPVVTKKNAVYVQTHST